ncbi:MAG: hypothetical protein PHE50_00070 [Dehalococcoidales bacterium]|nr:hypothetical protein [Dehalococcoidales bacterium]
MTVSELIDFLKDYPSKMPIAFKIYSEYCLLDPKETKIELKELSFPRSDGWIHDKRPDVPSQTYLVFPGN